MKPTRPFRVTIIDDASWSELEVYRKRGDWSGLQRSQSEILWLLRKVSAEAGAEVHFANDLDLGKDQVFVFREGKYIENSGIRVQDNRAYWAYLREADVLVLDVGGVAAQHRKLEPLAARDVERALDEVGLAASVTSQEIATLSTEYPGAAFFVKYRKEFAEGPALMILTLHDSVEGKSGPAELARYLDPLCSTDSTPFVRKYHPVRDIQSCLDSILSMHRQFSGGAVRLVQRAAIEFAASHDLPVLIVGESGTSKEHIAKEIHELSVRRGTLRKSGDNAPRFVVVNCGGLLPELARSELFGHVRGSFTGADDHRIGAILEACGVDGIRSQRKGLDYDGLREAAATLKSLATAIADYSAENVAGRPDGAARIAMQQIVPLLERELLPAKYAASVFAFVERFCRGLEEKAAGKDYVDEFRGELVRKNAGLLREKNQIDVEFSASGPFGTLFLDEFGDLPQPVQVLLLRFLEGSELQPLGYPGRVVNAKVRVIVATSDPEVGRFAGVRLRGTRGRASKEVARVREDLLFRVKGQVIHAEGMTLANARRDVAEIVRANTKSTWQPEAVGRLAELVEEQLRRVEGKGKLGDVDEGMPVFGHYREVSRFIELVSAYVRTARHRGLRPASDAVTPDLVEKLWRPAEVSEVGIAIGSGSSPARHRHHEDAWTLTRFVERGIVEDQSQEYFILEFLLLNAGKVARYAALQDHLGTDAVTKALEGKKRGKASRQTEALKQALSRLRGKVNNGPGKESGWRVADRGPGIFRANGADD